MELTDSVKGLLTSCITELIDNQDDLNVNVIKKDDVEALEQYEILDEHGIPSNILDKDLISNMLFVFVKVFSIY